MWNHPELWDKLLGRIKDPVLIFLAITLSVIVVAVVFAPADALNVPKTLGVMGVAAVVLLAGISIHYWFDQTSLTDALNASRMKITDLEGQLESPPISIISKRDYAQLIKNWNDAGEGHLLLFNIEMQSFQTDEDIHRTWGNIGDLAKMKQVVLLLPEHKVRRWERVVLIQEDKFFAEQKNRKFLVCEFDEEQMRDEIGSSAIGFALYRYGDNSGNGQLHSTALVFVMSGPFSQLRAPLIPEDDDWWDYDHIIKFENYHEVVSNLDQTWRRCFDHSKTRDLNRVIEDTRPLTPIEPSTLFDRLGCTPARKAVLLEHFQERHQVRAEPPAIHPANDRCPFTISYNNGEAIQGHCRGAEDQPKQAIVWVGGFTERRGSKLPVLFERTLKDEAVVQFYYEVSPPIEFITPTRYMQDLREVLRYVQRQRVVEPDRTIVIARSINGLLAALVASEEEFRRQLAGLILVAPVFDLIEMIDNYRATREEKKSHVRVEKCWRATPGYTADKWEDPQNGWLEFFDHQVSLTLLADIIRQDPETFSMNALKRAIGTISQDHPVFILSNPDDPVTGSQEALRMLDNAASGTGLIRDVNFRHIDIRSSHCTVVDRDKYPFAPRQEVRETRNALRAILGQLGAPLEVEEPALTPNPRD